MQLTSLEIAGIVCVWLAAAASATSSIVTNKMIDEINRTRARDNVLSHNSFGLVKYWRISREYGQANPNGKLPVVQIGANALAFIGWVGLAVCLWRAFDTAAAR